MTRRASTADLVAHRGFLAGYEAGIVHGIALGRAQVEAEDAAAWRHVAAVVRAAADRPDVATLAERRGERDRAARTRAVWRARGLDRRRGGAA